MNEYTGWLLDLYPHPERGIVLWLLCADGQRRCLVQDFPVTFYAAGPDQRLRELWIFLKKQPFNIKLARDERQDLFEGVKTVLSATLDTASIVYLLQRKITEAFPDLSLYDIDLNVSLRHSAEYGTFPLARCDVVASERGKIHKLQVLDSRWELDYPSVPLRVLTLEPDVDPFHTEPKQLLARMPGNELVFDIHDPLVIGWLNGHLEEYDTDLIVSSRGDTWLLPQLLKRANEQAQPLLLNRDPDGRITHKKARSYFAYNQVIYRGQQVHLAGRLHVDIHNTVMYGDYGLAGVFEMARVTSLPIQTVARVSPGTGISSMQIVKALELKILVPLSKEQVEEPKTTTQLFQEDVGGIVYDPIIGLHSDVAEVDFASMYPSIMVQFNVSPETVNSVKPTAQLVSGLDVIAEGRERPGLIPQTLAPLLEKRLKLKDLVLTLSPLDDRYKGYKAAAAAHKWLLVTCFGYLGYKNARFGKIEAHEAVTAYSREAMMRAKEAAEDLGYRVLHLYVDGMWVQKPGCVTPQAIQPLLDEIHDRTHLPIALDGIYKWVAFLSSRRNKKIAVPNLYFGIFQNGEIKTRGIETRRHDTAAFISETQMKILEILNKIPDPHQITDHLHEIRTCVFQVQADLRAGRIPLEKLIVHQTVSRNLDEFRVLTPAATAIKQLQKAGKPLRPGQSIRMLYTLGVPRARAWDLPDPFDARTLNIPRYESLLQRAVQTILEPFIGTDCLSIMSRFRQLTLAID
jgi:DNA polymerase II